MTFRDKWRSKDRSHGVQSHSPASCVPWSPQLSGSGTADVGGLLGSLKGGGGPGCRVSKGQAPHAAGRMQGRGKRTSVQVRPKTLAEGLSGVSSPSTATLRSWGWEGGGHRTHKGRGCMLKARLAVPTQSWGLSSAAHGGRPVPRFGAGADRPQETPPFPPGLPSLPQPQ